MCTCYPIINSVSELKVHIELTRFVQPEKIEIDANERAVNEKSPYCFFVCTTFDSFLNDLLSSSLYFIAYRKDSIFYETCRLGTACTARCPQMASPQKGSWRQPAQGKRSVPCMIWSRPWLRKITALRRGAFGERNAPTSGWCIIAPLVN